MTALELLLEHRAQILAWLGGARRRRPSAQVLQVLAAFVDERLVTSAAQSTSAEDLNRQRRERSEQMALGVDEESAGLLRVARSLNALAEDVRKRMRNRIEHARIDGRPLPYGGLESAPGLRFIRDRLSRNRAATLARRQLIHDTVAIIQSHFRGR